MNANEIKARVFGLYLNQPIVATNTRVINPSENTGWGLRYEDGDWKVSFGKNLFDIENRALSLRSVDQIEDGEVKAYLSIIGYTKPIIERHNFQIKIILGDQMGLMYFEDGRFKYYSAGKETKKVLSDSEIVAQVDYLRSIGIALPVTTIDEEGKPVTLSVGKMVEMGIMGIKK